MREIKLNKEQTKEFNKNLKKYSKNLNKPISPKILKALNIKKRFCPKCQEFTEITPIDITIDHPLFDIEYESYQCNKCKEKFVQISNTTELWEQVQKFYKENIGE